MRISKQFSHTNYALPRSFRYRFASTLFFIATLTAVMLGIIPPGVSIATVEARESAADAVSRERLAHPDLTGTLVGALVYLEDTQIRDRPGRGLPTRDASNVGDGCKNEMSLNLPFRENIPLPVPPIVKLRNNAGEWASFVHFMPKRTGFRGRNIVAVQDSNVFMTAFIAYPLFLFDDSALPSDRRPVSTMLPLAMSNIEGFRRGEAYNFWATMPGFYGHASRSGPTNIPVNFIDKLAHAYLNPKFDHFFTLFTRGMKTPPKYWLEQCFDASLNPTGADAFFNIPDDADDTSSVVAFQKLFGMRYPGLASAPACDALAVAARFRDIDRTKEDGRDAWKGKNTGAFLTWFRNENEPTFGAPDTGVIPLGVNNVDSVVNANTAFSLAMNDMKTLPGYSESLDLLAATVEKHAWPDAGLYYPQYMIFPYTVSRAWRDGGAREGRMGPAMEKLLIDLLDTQDAWGKTNPGHIGAFPGGEDRSDHLSTALGLSALLNIGRATAVGAGQGDRYDRAITSAVSYLCKNARTRDDLYPTTRRVFPGRRMNASFWDSGLFFAASFWDLGQWRSEAFTVSMVAEALGKYALGYDLDDKPFATRRLRLIDDRTTPLGMRFEAK
ncbi:MAG: hypothetical protein HQM09_20880 [Candidatus Riflebacteria bacterium]|nr:hypothetical protein [Candidatus Riflebacteria bacterium]